MSTTNKVRGIIGVLTGTAYLILALAGADGVAWVIPAVVAGVAYSLIGVMNRPGGRERNRNRNRRR